MELKPTTLTWESAYGTKTGVVVDYQPPAGFLCLLPNGKYVPISVKNTRAIMASRGLSLNSIITLKSIQRNG